MSFSRANIFFKLSSILCIIILNIFNLFLSLTRFSNISSYYIFSSKLVEIASYKKLKPDMTYSKNKHKK
jgi:hypothetical protein